MKSEETKIDKLRRHIKEEGIVRGILRIIKIMIAKIERPLFRKYWTIKGKFSSSVIEKPYEVIYVPVRKINYIANKSRKERIKKGPRKKIIASSLRVAGIISNDNWALNKKDFEDSNKFIAIKERFMDGKKWKNTSYYDLFLKKDTTESRNYDTWNEFKKYLLEKDQLYENIKNNGYKSYRETSIRPEDEIEVIVSREGEIIKSFNGQHRLAIAKILDIKEVPVIVNVWHKEYIDWVKKKYDLKKITPKTAIQPILRGEFKKYV